MFKFKSKKATIAESTDLQSQLEDLLDTVWRCEARAKLHDRIDAQAQFDALRMKIRAPHQDSP